MGQRGLSARVADWTHARLATGGGRASLLQKDGVAIASWLNDKDQCDLFSLARDLTYAQLELAGVKQSCYGAMAPP